MFSYIPNSRHFRTSSDRFYCYVVINVYYKTLLYIAHKNILAFCWFMLGTNI